MPLREREREQASEHGRRQPLHEAAAGHDVFDAILVQTLPVPIGSIRCVCRQVLNGPRTCSSQNCRPGT